MDVVCDRCGWRVTPGMFIEVNITPDLLATLPEEWTMGYLEAEHFLESGCRGRVIRAPAWQLTATYLPDGWRHLPTTQQFERDGFRITCAHVQYYGWPPT